MGPLVAPSGTVVSILVDEYTFTMAVVPLNFTTLSASVLPKFVPVMMTVVPTVPLKGLTSTIVGCPISSLPSLQADSQETERHTTSTLIIFFTKVIVTILYNN